LLFADRRRSVRGQPQLGFATDTGSIAATFALERTTRLRLEGGLQAYSARTTSGARALVSAEIAHVHGRGTMGARVSWFSGRISIGGGGGFAASVPEPGVQPTPTPPET